MSRRRVSRARAGVLTLGVVAAVAAGLFVAPASADTAGQANARPAGVRQPAVPRSDAGQAPALPSPPRPPSGRPRAAPPGQHPAAGTTSAAGTASSAGRARVGTAAAAVPASAHTFGPPGPATALVLYDTTGAYGWLGELYAIGAGTLATHFGSVTAEPVTSYLAGQVDDYDATVYLGSTYDEPLPAALLSDVTTTTRPVIWAGFNVWQLAGPAGSTTATAFRNRYGWDAATSYLDSTDTIVSVQYKGRTLTRSPLNTGGLLAPHITTPSAVDVLAQAMCSSGGAPVACAPIAQSGGSTIPWAIRSANLTYVGEIPFSYISETDRYLAYADLLFPALAPSAAASRHAAVRLEDVNPTSDPTTLRRFADYLSSQGVPFSVGVIPEYTDPTGYYTGGQPQTVTLAQAPAVVAALEYMQSKGGTLIQHGFTHQYSDVANPYDGVSGDDFEFYRARCSTTPNPPYQFEPCQNTDWVIQEGPLPGDSALWAASRVDTGRSLFAAAGLGPPTVFETPHYSASAADYLGMGQVYSTRYERELFFGGLLDPANSPARVFGQFFPYRVTDLYGSTVLPENLGNYEPEASNHNPPRSAADIVNNAAANQVVTQSVASLFFHPDYPLAQLQSIVSGIKALGYTFVPAAGL